MSGRGRLRPRPALEEMHTHRGDLSSARWLGALLRPARLRLAVMLSATAAGAVVALAVPLGLGALVNTLASGSRHHVAAWAFAIPAAVVASAAAFAVSDALYARVAADLHRRLRLAMFDGVAERAALAREPGLAARFVSDVQGLDDATIAVLDTGVLETVGLVAALAVLASIDPWAVAVVVAVIAAGVLVARRTQRPVAAAGLARQEALESMTAALGAGAGGPDARGAFRRALDRVVRSEVRLGRLQAVNGHGSSVVAGLAPVAVVAAAAGGGNLRAGTLLAVYLVAERAFSAAESLVDLRLDVEAVRGAVARCRELAPVPVHDEGAAGRGAFAAEAGRVGAT